MKNVLLATDGSTFAEEAAWFLSHMPHKDKLQLTVLSVMEIPFVSRQYMTGDWLQESLDRDKGLAQEAFQRIETMFEGANVALRHEIREGQRAETIVQTAQELGSDLVVVGAKGHSRIERLLLGSASDYVATHAPCSVLVVRPTGLRDSKRPIRIAIGYEETKAAQAAIDEFSEITWGRQTEVHVVGVVSMAAGFVIELVADTQLVKEGTARDVANATLVLHRGAAPGAIAHCIESNHIGEGLVNFAEDKQCDLVVVGETHRRFTERTLLGSVSRYVLRHAPCSVWITRNRMLESANKSETKKEYATT